MLIELKEYFKFGKKLVIIGAGYIGLEVAAAVAIEKGLSVTLVEMADRSYEQDSRSRLFLIILIHLHRNKWC